MSSIFQWFAGANWESIVGVFAAFVLFFDRLAKLIPSSTTNTVLSILLKISTVLGAKVPDVK